MFFSLPYATGIHFGRRGVIINPGTGDLFFQAKNLGNFRFASG
jgi:hypothetical protein